MTCRAAFVLTFSTITLSLLISLAARAGVDSFAQCESLTNQIAQSLEGTTGSLVRPADVVAFASLQEKNALAQSPTTMPDGSLMILKSKNLVGSIDKQYLFFKFTRDAAGKVTELSVKDEDKQYFHLTFKVDDAKNTCVLETASADYIDTFKFDLKKCGQALALTKAHPGLDHCSAFKPLNAKKESKLRGDYIGPQNDQWFNDCVTYQPALMNLRNECRGPDFLMKYAKKYFSDIDHLKGQTTDQNNPPHHQSHLLQQPIAR